MSDQTEPSRMSIEEISDDPVLRTVQAVWDRGGIVGADYGQLETAWREVLDEELRERVGLRVAATLDDDELDAFEAADGDETLTRAWFATYAPNYRQIVQEELASLAAIAATWFLRRTARHSAADDQD